MPTTPIQQAALPDVNLNPSGTVNFQGVTPATQSTNANITGQQVMNPDGTDVTPKATVSGQIKSLIDQNSPLMQQAQTSALQQMNGRGLLNSSMAIGAGQDALYKSALPIAQQDASTVANAKIFDTEQANKIATQNALNQNQTSQFNQTQANQVGEFNAQNALTAAKSNADAANQLQQQQLQQQMQTRIANMSEINKGALADMDASVKQAMQTADNNTKVALENLSNAAKMELTNLDGQYRTLLQTSASAQGIFSSFTNAMTQLMLSTGLTPEAKASAMGNQITMLKAGMDVLGSIGNLDLGSLVNFGTSTGA